MTPTENRRDFPDVERSWYLERAVRRPKYFEGRLLTAADFEQEQQYHRDMRSLHNRALGFGIVEGLDVQASGDVITVSPGFAIDPLGREVVVGGAVQLDADETTLAAVRTLALTVTWAQVPADPVPSDDPSAGPVAYASWLEEPVIALEPPQSVTPPSLVLALVRRRRKKGVLIDLAGRDAFRLRW